MVSNVYNYFTVDGLTLDGVGHAYSETGLCAVEGITFYYLETTRKHHAETIAIISSVRLL